MKLAVVVQRYGADINGGAELHARYIAERLVAARRGRGRHDLRARLRHVAQRAARPASNRSTASPCAGSRSGTSAIRIDFGRRSRRVFEHPHSIADELALARERRAGQPGARQPPRHARPPTSTSSSSSAIATTTRGTARGACRRRRSSCRPPSAIRPIGARRSSARRSAACAASCTTRTKSAR